MAELTQEEKDRLHDMVADAIEPRLEQARIEGVQIGWYTCCLQMYKNTKDLHNVKAVRAYLKKEADNMLEKFKLKETE